MAWRCHISNFRSVGHQEPGQEHPYPPSQGWILGGQEVEYALEVSNWCLGLINMSDNFPKKFGKNSESRTEQGFLRPFSPLCNRVSGSLWLCSMTI